MKRSLKALILAVSLSAISFQAYGFWSMYGVFLHQWMTSAALWKPFDDLQFSLRAIEQLQLANQAADDENKKPYSANDHFDSERLIGGLNALKERRARLISLLSVDDPYSQQTNAWTHLGLIFHAIQDFYSHSSWVRTPGGTVITNFGKWTFPNAQVPGWARHAGDIGAVCNASGVEYSISSAAITTGYYPPFSRGASKCEHGDVKFWARNCVSLVPLRYGIALDVYCSAVPADKGLQRTASSLAEAETRQFVLSVIDQLNDAGKQKGICALLDVPETRCPAANPLRLKAFGIAEEEDDPEYRLAINPTYRLDTLEFSYLFGANRQSTVESGENYAISTWYGAIRSANVTVYAFTPGGKRVPYDFSIEVCQENIEARECNELVEYFSRDPDTGQTQCRIDIYASDGVSDDSGTPTPGTKYREASVSGMWRACAGPSASMPSLADLMTNSRTEFEFENCKVMVDPAGADEDGMRCDDMSGPVTELRAE